MRRARLIVASISFIVAATIATLAGAGAQDSRRSREVSPTSRRWAVVVDGVTKNVVSWDGVQLWTPPAGAILVEEARDVTGLASPRAPWDGTRFGVPDRAPEQAAARAEAIRLTAEADAASTLAAVASGDERRALLADETRLRAEATAALERVR